jgi:hypothetical protein
MLAMSNEPGHGPPAEMDSGEKKSLIEQHVVMNQ